MKKLFAGLISLAAALFAICAITVCAGAETSGDYEYSVLSDGTVEITAYVGDDTELEIPSTLDGKRVTSIGNYSFLGHTNLYSVILPDTVKYIKESAFEVCTSLTSITLSKNLTSIGYAAFNECINIKSITLPNSVTSIEDWAFANCRNLISIAIPNGVTTIGENTLAFCENLTSVTLPRSLTSIGEQAFDCCYSLNSINIPNSVTSIGNEAFSCCESLTSINIPNGVTSIGNNAFSACSSLKSITVDKDNKYYSSQDGVLFNKDMTEIIKCPDAKNGGYVIPDGVTNIGYRAFDGCEDLTSITISESVTSIGDMAFFGCSNLATIKIPDSVTIIGNQAFSYCTSLTSITIPDSVTSIQSYAFDNCSSLKDVYYPGSKSQWDKIAIDEYNDNLLNATIHYNYSVVPAPSSVTGLNLKGRSGDALRIAWTKNTSADGYIIEMKDGTKWTRVSKITNNSTVEFKKSKLKAGTAYTFRVKAYKMDGKTALYSGYTTISARTNPSAVSGLKLKARAADALRLTWTKNTSADGYIIEMKSGNSWTRVGKITKNSTIEFKKSGLKAGTAYTFRVKAYKMSGKTALYGATKTISVRTNPSAVSGLKLKASAKNAVRLSWTKNTSADGYIIEMKSGNSWVRVGKIAKNSTVEFKISGLKSKTSYTFRIKTYKMSGKTALYGTTKTITVKTK